ncbi:MAG: MmoB/DmpM family protein [Legionellales bacterium]|nr:MmoB/DmpM family protein [Legionellales bacterium]
MSTDNTNNWDLSDGVGPVLLPNTTSAAIIQAIRELNYPVVVEDKLAYWRVLVPKYCEVTLACIEKYLNDTFYLPQDLEKNMTAFRGKLQILADKLIWSYQPLDQEKNRS